MAGWPTIEDVRGALVEAGIPVPANARLTSALTLAIEALEAETGYHPFAAASGATATEEALSYPAGSQVRVIPFVGGALPSPALVVKKDGTTLTSGEDYTLKPENAARLGKPYSRVVLARPVSQSSPEGGFASGRITVTAVWGYCAHNAVPELARQAVIAYAALELSAGAVQSGTVAQRLTQVEEGDVRYQWGSSIEERTAALAQWRKDWERALSEYKRNTVV